MRNYNAGKIGNSNVKADYSFDRNIAQESNFPNYSFYNCNFKATNPGFKLQISKYMYVDPEKLEKFLEKFPGANVDLVKLFDDVEKKIEKLRQSGNLVEHVIKCGNDKYTVLEDKEGNEIAVIDSSGNLEIHKRMNRYIKEINGNSYVAGDSYSSHYTAMYDKDGRIYMHKARN